MESSFFNELLEESRLLSVLADNLPDEIKSDELYNFIQQYVEKYARSNSISAEQAIDVYTNFISLFNKHCKQFIKTGKYPLENGLEGFSISREDYDIILLLSILFTPHRFRIMQLLHQKAELDKALFIGLGPGLEVSLTKENFKVVDAYDLSISNFLYTQFPDVQFNAELYTGQKENYYDAIYMIELLEHLDDPFSLLRICYSSLTKGGQVFLTTATDIPQFDHLYNFPKDHTYFDDQVSKMGFSIIYKEMIPHNYLTMDLKPCNHFYILQKN